MLMTENKQKITFNIHSTEVRLKKTVKTWLAQHFLMFTKSYLFEHLLLTLLFGDWWTQKVGIAFIWIRAVLLITFLWPGKLVVFFTWEKAQTIHLHWAKVGFNSQRNNQNYEIKPKILIPTVCGQSKLTKQSSERARQNLILFACLIIMQFGR